jgi:hypothetical protein
VLGAMAEHWRIERIDYDDLLRDVRETADRGDYFYSVTHCIYRKEAVGIRLPLIRIFSLWHS